MLPGQKRQKTLAKSPTANVYRSVSYLFRDFIDLIYGPVIGETDGGTHHIRNNVHCYALIRCNVKNPSSAFDTEKEEQLPKFRIWLEQFIIDPVMLDIFRVWASIKKNTYTLYNKQRITGTDFQPNKVTISHHLIKYRTGITTKMKWMVV